MSAHNEQYTEEDERKAKAKPEEIIPYSEPPMQMGLSLFALEQAKEQHDLMRKYIASFMVKGEDYGPGRGQQGGKNVLLKPGAEKLCQLLKLRPSFRDLEIRNDFDNKIFFYRYACDLYHQPSDKLVGSANGSCNNQERKYAHAQNPADLINTFDKIAQKRALVAAVLIVCAGSDLFTQDFGDEEEVDERTGEVKSKPTAPPPVPAPSPSVEVDTKAALSLLETKIRSITAITFRNPDELLAEVLGNDEITFDQLHRAKPTEARLKKLIKGVEAAQKLLTFLESQRGPGEESEVAK